MLKINDKFAINSDDNQFVLLELGTVQDEKSKNYGEYKETTLGYYPTLEGACMGLEKILQRRAIKSKDYTIKIVVDEIRAIHEEIFNHFKGE